MEKELVEDRFSGGFFCARTMICAKRNQRVFEITNHRDGICKTRRLGFWFSLIGGGEIRRGSEQGQKKQRQPLFFVIVDDDFHGDEREIK
ncbi:hypothetical protein U1Q18_050412 [Sarracenia purpurea var. burkii]